MYNCRSDCPGDQKQEARASITEAYEHWRHTLDYMDKELIYDARSDLDTAINRAMPCIIVNLETIRRIDSVCVWHSRSRPVSEELARAEELLTLISGELTVE